MPLSKSLKLNRIFIYIAAIFITFSFSKKDDITVTGKVYIKLIDVHNAYRISEEQPRLLEDFINNVNQEETTDSEKKLTEYLRFLREKKLIKKPFFKLKTDTDTIINVFTDESEYEKISKVLEGFNRDKEEIVVKFDGAKRSDGFFNEPIYFADRIISVEKMPGKTDWKK